MRCQKGSQYKITDVTTSMDIANHPSSHVYDVEATHRSTCLSLMLCFLRSQSDDTQLSQVLSICLWCQLCVNSTRNEKPFESPIGSVVFARSSIGRRPAVASGNVSHSLGPRVLRRQANPDNDADEQTQEYNGGNAAAADGS